MASGADGLYVLFRLPLGSVQVARGEGGGAGLGYALVDSAATGWLTVDGDEWFRMHETIELGVEVETTEADLTTLRLERDAGKSLLSAPSAEPAPVLVDAFDGPSPNPFNPTTVLTFSTRRSGPLTLEIFDLRGRRLAVLADGVWSAGKHEVEWSGRTDADEPLASGVYLARLETHDFEATQRLVLIR